MERIIKFGILLIIMEAATAFAIKLADGHPFSSMSGWSGVLALVGLLFVAAIIVGGLWALGKGSFDNDVLILLVVVGTAGILAIGFVGLTWLTEPLDSLKEGGGIWWPVVVLVACIATWFLGLSRQTAGRRPTR